MTDTRKGPVLIDLDDDSAAPSPSEVPPVPDLTPYGGVELTAVGESDHGPAGGVVDRVGALQAGAVGVDGRVLEAFDNVHVVPGVVLELLVAQAAWAITSYCRKDLTTRK